MFKSDKILRGWSKCDSVANDTSLGFHCFFTITQKTPSLKIDTYVQTFHISNKREIFYFILTPLLSLQNVPHLDLCCRIGEQKCFEQSLFRCVGVLQKVFYQVSPHHWYSALPSRITNLWMKLLDFMWMTISSHTCMLYIMYKWVIVNYLSIEYLV